jgi:hypothetical protein
VLITQKHAPDHTQRPYDGDSDGDGDGNSVGNVLGTVLLSSKSLSRCLVCISVLFPEAEKCILYRVGFPTSIIA